jgi:hypothetical protein
MLLIHILRGIARFAEINAARKWVVVEWALSYPKRTHLTTIKRHPGHELSGEKV